MTIGSSLQRYPLLRLIVAYVCGVAAADKLYAHVDSLLMWALACSAGALLLMLCTCARRHRLWNVAFGVAASVMFLSLGVAGYSIQRDSMRYEWSDAKRIYEARVLEVPRERERSVLCVMQVNAVHDSIEWHAVRRKVFVYMQPDTTARTLLPGDVVCFEGRVEEPRNFSEDLTFDYARYVTMQGASGTVYLPRESWVCVDSASDHTLREKMLRLRHRLQHDYMYTAFTDDALGVLAALTMGDKRTLNDEVRAAYTDAGAAHALALSGLHVGVIYAMLAFLMRGLVRRRSLRWLCELVTVAMLWLFALMVGMSASVVRAVFMYTLYVLARWISKDSAPLGVLSLAAMVMLMLKPIYLFDVGFQLSFMAMAAILWLEPHMEMLFCRASLPRVVSYFIGVICMSLAAQLGTLPLTLYHFGTFPSYFLLTNLVVMPLLSLVLVLSVVWWLLILLRMPLSQPLGQLLQHLTQWMNDILAHISQWPGAVLHADGFNAMSALSLYLLILFVGLFVVKKWPRGFVFALVALLGLLVSFLL